MCIHMLTPVSGTPLLRFGRDGDVSRYLSTGDTEHLVIIKRLYALILITLHPLLHFSYAPNETQDCRGVFESLLRGVHLFDFLYSFVFT